MAKAEAQAVFERHEIKYLLNAQQTAALVKRLEGYMAQDEYGLHTISSIYYDTWDYEIIRKCLDKPILKEKLRLRSYGTPRGNSPVFLELKKKFAGMTYKRRVPLELNEADLYLLFDIKPPVAGQIFSEIDWFVNNHVLEPKVLISYDRVAYTCESNPNLRLTLDSKIRYRDYEVDLSRGSYGREILNSGQRMMEIKTAGSIPACLSAILSELAIYPTSFSKYGAVYKQYLLERKEVQYAG